MCACRYERVRFDERDGAVVTVQLPDLGPMFARLCQHWLLTKKVDDVLEGMGYTGMDYLHRVYFMPQQWSDCSFSGQLCTRTCGPVPWHPAAGKHCTRVSAHTHPLP